MFCRICTGQPSFVSNTVLAVPVREKGLLQNYIQLRFKKNDISLIPAKTEEGKWLDWGEWTPCNGFCGGGFSIRFRECTGNAYPYLDCVGSSFEISPCNTHPCPPYSMHTYGYYRLPSKLTWNNCHITKFY